MHRKSNGADVTDDRTLIAVADAAPKAGLGHLSRSSAVIAGLTCRGQSVRALALDATGPVTVDGVSWEPCSAPDLMEVTGPHRVALLDSYTLTEPDLPGGLLACFHDPGSPIPQLAQMVIAPAVTAPEHEGWLSGFHYACLRPGYWGVEPIQPAAEVGRVLVSTGGTDPAGIAWQLVSAVRQAVPEAEILRVRGTGAEPIMVPGLTEVVAPPDLRAELSRSDLVVCLGGQTALEAACLGVPTVAIAAFENQQANVDGLARAGAVVTPGSAQSLEQLIRDLSLDPERRRRLSSAAHALVDGFGALRVAGRIADRLKE